MNIFEQYLISSNKKLLDFALKHGWGNLLSPHFVKELRVFDKKEVDFLDWLKTIDK